MLSITQNHAVSVRMVFLFLLVLRIGLVLLELQFPDTEETHIQSRGE